uniref:Uncharacterized protein n=1 Tax=Anopheles atroparvus TaxID=41427 RepID=A0A182JEE9_ANOAO
MLNFTVCRLPAISIPLGRSGMEEASPKPVTPPTPTGSTPTLRSELSLDLNPLPWMKPNSQDLMEPRVSDFLLQASSSPSGTPTCSSEYHRLLPLFAFGCSPLRQSSGWGGVVRDVWRVSSGQFGCSCSAEELLPPIEPLQLLLWCRYLLYASHAA